MQVYCGRLQPCEPLTNVWGLVGHWGITAELRTGVANSGWLTLKTRDAIGHALYCNRDALRAQSSTYYNYLLHQVHMSLCCYLKSLLARALSLSSINISTPRQRSTESACKS